MNKQASFHIGERVWACDKGKHYDAKILRYENIGSLFKYFVHYNKWDRKYDTWMDESSIEPYNDGIHPKTSSKLVSTLDDPKLVVAAQSETLSKDSELSDINNLKSDTNLLLNFKRRTKSNGITFPIPIVNTFTSPANHLTSSNEIRKLRKELANSDLMQDDEEDSFPIKFDIPCDLKRHLVDEWMIITQESSRRMIPIPVSSQVCVRTIVNQFVEEKKKKSESQVC